jgi:hypothetical protein
MLEAEIQCENCCAKKFVPWEKRYAGKDPNDKEFAEVSCKTCRAAFLPGRTFYTGRMRGDVPVKGRGVFPLFVLVALSLFCSCAYTQRAGIENERRRAEIRTLLAEAKMLETCAWRQARGLECALPAHWPVTISRAPDTKSMVGIELPSLTQVITGGVGQ